MSDERSSDELEAVKRDRARLIAELHSAHREADALRRELERKGESIENRGDLLADLRAERDAAAARADHNAAAVNVNADMIVSLRGVVQAVNARAQELRDLAEQWLYDGDTDQPINDGYRLLHDLAWSIEQDVRAALAARLRATLGQDPEGNRMRVDVPTRYIGARDDDLWLWQSVIDGSWRCSPAAPQPEPGGEDRWDQGDDVAKTIHVLVTNPEGVTFPAVLGSFQKAGVVTFYVLHEDAPEGEESGERTEFYREVPTSLFGNGPKQRIYTVQPVGEGQR